MSNPVSDDLVEDRRILVADALDEMAKNGLPRGTASILSRASTFLREAAAKIAALSAERDEALRLAGEDVDALQAIGEEFGIEPGEHRVTGVRRLLTEHRAQLKAAREALEPSAETKAAYIGEFQFTVTTTAVDECDEPYEVQQTVTVPWTTIKEVMAAIRARAALNPKAPS